MRLLPPFVETIDTVVASAADAGAALSTAGASGFDVVPQLMSY